MLIKDTYIYYFRLYLLLIYHYTLSILGYGNMEVLASMNRMSAITFSHFTFIVKMALDYNFNHNGLAHHNFNGSIITHFIFATFLLLFTIPIHVQVVTICDRLHFHRWIHALSKNFHHIFQVVLGLYPLAQDAAACRNPHTDCMHPH